MFKFIHAAGVIVGISAIKTNERQNDSVKKFLKNGFTTAACCALMGAGADACEAECFDGSGNNRVFNAARQECQDLITAGELRCEENFGRMAGFRVEGVPGLEQLNILGGFEGGDDRVRGHVIIGSNPDLKLVNIQTLGRVNGDLKIENNPQLGLENDENPPFTNGVFAGNVNQVDGAIAYNNNDESTFFFLPNLANANNGIQIEGNERLASTEFRMDKIGNTEIKNNPNMNSATFNGEGDDAKFTGNFNAEDNNNLRTVQFTNVGSVDGELRIVNNNAFGDDAQEPNFSNGLFVESVRNMGSVDISGNDQLKSVSLAGIDSTGNVKVENNNALGTFDVGFREGQANMGNVEFNNNNNLDRVQLTRVDNVDGLEFRNNDKLDDIQTSINNVNENVIIDNNNELKAPVFPTITRVGGNVIVGGNNDLGSVGFEQLNDIGGQIEIRENPVLSLLDFRALEDENKFAVLEGFAEDECNVNLGNEVFTTCSAVANNKNSTEIQ